MEIQEVLNLAIVGGILSWVLEYATTNFSENQSKMITIGLSILVGFIYWFLSQTGLWQSVLGVLVSASTIYAFVMKSK